MHGPPLQSRVVRTVTPTLLTPEVIEELRTADHIVNRALVRHGLDKSLSQVPVVLLPVDLEGGQRRTVVLRPFMTQDFMTGTPAIPGKHFPLPVLLEVCNNILASCPGVSRICYDLTSKPPGTTEWE